MTTNHTQTLLHLCSHDNRTIIRDDQGHWIADTRSVRRTPAEDNANALRLIACWNALDGLHQDALDGNWNYRGMNAYAKGLEGQLAEVRETARKALANELRLAKELASARALLREVLTTEETATFERIRSYLDACDTLGDTA